SSHPTCTQNKFLRCVGVSLVPMAIICMLSNILLLLPELKPRFLLEGHVTREATWATGLWGSGLLALYSCVGLLAASGCSLVSATGLSQGPLCLYNSIQTRRWRYLYNQTLWSGVCMAPRSVVQWNVVLFSIMGITSALQAVLCGLNILNSLLGCSSCEIVRPGSQQ
uniref:Uncharacterized protein n=1 Tax=Fundulus heteroclitus TaxID=8078 RepID=A0A3Q2U8A6_FUNHE